MDVREKLVELLGKVQDYGTKNTCEKWSVTIECKDNETIVNHLIAHGVTVQERNGCDYCQEFDDPCGVPMIAKEDSDSDIGIYLYNGFLCANGGEFCDARVNYCPMCGRKLPTLPKGE